jgi:hypothetical protein
LIFSIKYRKSPAYAKPLRRVNKALGEPKQTKRILLRSTDGTCLPAGPESRLWRDWHGRQKRETSLLSGPIKIWIFPRNREGNADDVLSAIAPLEERPSGPRGWRSGLPP